MIDNTANTMVLERVLAVNKDNWNFRADRVFTPQLLQLTDLLHELFYDARSKNLEKRKNEFKPALKNSDSIFSSGIEIEWNGSVKYHVPSSLKSVRSVVAVSPDSTHQISKYFANTDASNAIDAVLFDFEDAFKPALGNLIAAYTNLTDVATGHPRFIQKQNPFQFGTVADPVKQPEIFIRLRGLHQPESSFVFGTDYASASIVDLVFSIYTQVKHLNQNQKNIFLIIPKCYDAGEANWWNNVISELEDIFGIENGSIKVILEVAAVRNCVQLDAMIFELRNRIAGLYANMRAKYFDDLRHHVKKTGEIFPARIQANHDATATMNFLNFVRDVALKYNLHSIAGLGLNAAGNLYPSCEDADVAKYEKEIELLNQLNFDATQVTHVSFAILIAKGSDTENKNKAALSEMFNYGINKISVSDLRDNLRAAIEFIHAWEQGIASAFFDNRYEDVISFDVIRAQIRQWVTNFVITTEGEKINSRLVTMLLLEESDKLKSQLEEEFDGNPTAEMRTILNTYTQATLKLEQILLDESVPEFFNAAARH